MVHNGHESGGAAPTPTLGRAAAVAATTPGRHDAESDDDAACWEAAARVRRQRPGWVVIWVARKGQYQARPLFRAAPGTVATAVTPEGLTAQMETIQQAARSRPLRRKHQPSRPSATTR
jgi:hypothetical protein